LHETFNIVQNASATLNGICPLARKMTSFR